MATEKERRIQNLLMARHRYSQFTREKLNEGKQDSDLVKQSVSLQRKDIERIEEELAKCRQMHESIIKDIGKAHKSAKVEECKENLSQKIAQIREDKVRSRAKMVLAEEIQNMKTSEINKKLQKEILLKKRRELFGSKFSRSKSKLTREYTLEDCILIEEVLSNELQRLMNEKKREKCFRPPLRVIDSQKETCNQHTVRQISPKRSIQIQTDPIKESVQVQTEVINDSVQLTLPNIEDVVGFRISKKLTRQGIMSRRKPFNSFSNQQSQSKISVFSPSKTTRPPPPPPPPPLPSPPPPPPPLSPLTARKVLPSKVKETGTNTSYISPVKLKADETYYLSLPHNSTRYLSHANSEINDSDISSNVNVTEISEVNEIDLKDLINQIKSIRALINEQKKNFPDEIGHSKAEMDLRRQLNQTFCQKVLRNSQTHVTLSPTKMSISSCSEETNKNDETASLTVSLEDVTGAVQASCYTCESDTSLTSLSESQSFQPSVNFSNFSQMLNVDKDIFWKDILRQAGLKGKEITSGIQKTPQKATSLRDFRYHSTPLIHHYRLAKT